MGDVTRVAITKVQLEVVKILFAHDPHVTISGGIKYSIIPNSLVLRDATETGNIEMVKLILTYPDAFPSFYHNDGIWKNYVTSTALIAAVEKGHIDVVKVLLDDPRTDPFPDIKGNWKEIFIQFG